MRRSTGFTLGAAALVVLAIAGAGELRAQDRDSLIDSNVVFQLGGYLLSTDTTVRLDGSTERLGTDINLEDDFGFDDVNRFRADALWRISPRHHLRGSWFALDQDASRRVERRLEFGDIVIPLQTEVSADLQTSIWELAYEYAFVHKPKYEIAGSIGAHAISFDLELAASVGSGGAFQTRREEAETSAPLPVVGLRGLWQLGNVPLYLELGGQYFQAAIDEYDGDIQNYRLTLQWMPWEHFGFGAGYEQFNVDVDVDAERFDGSLSWEYGGLIAFANIAF
jgi:hypothetical protein